MSHRILIVDDDVAMCEMLEQRLSKRGFLPAWRTTAEEGLSCLGEAEVDVVVTDLNLQSMNGIEFCERVAANRPDVPVVVITAFGSLDSAVAAIRAGAYDFITKPFEIEQLVLSLDRAAQHRKLREEVKRLREAVSTSRRFDELIGASAKMKAVFDLMDRVADSDVSVLLTGESGTGKELVARALHRRGPRASGPFVAVSCAAVPENLLESEMFGHRKGAFTDARSSRTGLFVQADRGTLFLDEIGDMPSSLQPKLLRVLEERAVRPVGSNDLTPFDVRLIAATNRDLESDVEEGRFREDLYFRINVVHVDMPPLRARGGDVLLMAQHFVSVYAARAGKNISGLSSEVADKLLAYSWPGNVRELRNCMERAVVMARYDQVAVDDLPEKIRNYKSSHVIVAAADPTELVPMDEVERRYIARVLEAVGGNKTLAARVLGFDRKTLYRKMVRFGMTDENEADR